MYLQGKERKKNLKKSFSKKFQKSLDKPLEIGYNKYIEKRLRLKKCKDNRNGWQTIRVRTRKTLTVKTEFENSKKIQKTY